MEFKSFEGNLEKLFQANGYEKGKEILIVNNSLDYISKLVSKINYIPTEKNWLCSKKRLVKITQNILDNFFDIHDVKIIKDKIVENIEFAVLFGILDPQSIEAQATLKSPYKIPIKSSETSETNVLSVNDEKYFYAISIEKVNSKLKVPTYAHEIAHTQLLSKKGSNIDYHNREAISIFLENLAAFHLDDSLKTLKNSMLFRYKDLLQCIDFLKNNDQNNLLALNCSIYIISTLKALYMFEKYFNFETKEREAMLKYIQNIFDGKETVEDVLKRYDLTLENSANQKVLNKQLKIFKQ